MKKCKCLLAIVAWLAVGSIAGCGQTGPLMLPLDAETQTPKEIQGSGQNEKLKQVSNATSNEQLK